ncbi:hypothetical protein [Hymenobacter cavernae]|uniref:CBM6 domain-containing protein n=1 Tax=Hymenobacter cavernae TaxID=2044852 RepID=A0ABQ1UU98_9BACT|nr:hypothetical protein [Hymenobacter cavernae]GGF26333.1 hypothetical protein GCM10011383_42320 [Hymenobacter cavernae]
MLRRHIFYSTRIPQAKKYIIDPASITTSPGDVFRGYPRLGVNQGNYTVPLFDTSGVTSSKILTVTSAGAIGVNGGYNNAAGALGYGQDSWFTAHYANSGTTVSYQFTGLNDAAVYELTLIGSRAGSTEVRVTNYTVSGVTKSHQSTTQDGLGNRTLTSVFSNLKSAGGKLSFSFNAAPGSTFGYLNIIQLVEVV